MKERSTVSADRELGVRLLPFSLRRVGRRGLHLLGDLLRLRGEGGDGIALALRDECLLRRLLLLTCERSGPSTRQDVVPSL